MSINRVALSAIYRFYVSHLPWVT